MTRRKLSQALAERDELRFIFGSNKTEALIDVTSSAEEKNVARDLVIPSFSFVPDGKPVRYYYDSDELQQWALNDIKLNGIRSALWVRPHPSHPGTYELVAGFRRLKAAEIIQLSEVPIKVFDWDDHTAFQAAVSENANRRDFSALEELDNTLRLLEIHTGFNTDEVVSLLYRMNNATKGNTNQNVLVSSESEIVKHVFDTFSRITWQSFVATRLSLLKKPQEILDEVRQGNIHYTKAMLIAGVKSLDLRQQLLKEAVLQNHSLAEIKNRIKKITDSTTDRVEVNLRSQLTSTLKQIKSNQSIWGDPKKSKELEKVLSQLESLLGTKISN
jgi:ParB family transcriptional regulator, chromosome partitioning protein